jgi:protein O-GlcNAc transferase
MISEEKLQKVKKLTNDGYLIQQKGNIREAMKLYKKALLIDPDFMIALNNLANTYNLQEKYDLSYPLLKKVLAIDKEYIHGNFNMGYTLWKKHKYSEAIKCLKKVLESDHKYFDAYLILGNCYSDTEDYGNAISVLESGLIVKPGCEPMMNNLANAYNGFDRKKDAISTFQNIIKINPSISYPYISLARLYLDEQKYDKATVLLKKAIEIDPKDYSAYCSLGNMYMERDRYIDAIVSNKIAQKLRPTNHIHLTNIYEGLRNICDWDNSEKIENMDVFRNNSAALTSIIAYDDSKVNLNVAKRESKQIEDRINYQFKTHHRRQKNEKIRIGYLSADIRNHPVGHLIQGIFKKHNKNKFESHVYSYGLNDKSIYRANIERECNYFVDCFGWSSKSIANRIYDDKIDILIDLMGYTFKAKPEIMAMKPARVQIQFLGFPGTSGSEYIDYLIADKIVIPKEQAKYYSEKILYLPNSYLITNDETKINKQKYCKKDFHLPENKLVLGSFVSPMKIDRKVYRVWMNILKSNPNSILWLRNAISTAKDNLYSEAKKMGVNPNRIIFSILIPKREDHLARLSLCDLGLDTFTYGGHSTTNDLLWAGVPVITVLGNHFASRVGASILIAAGLSECVVKNEIEYQTVVSELINNPKKLSALKRKLKKNIKTSPFFSTKKFMKNFERIIAKVV